MTIMVCPSEVLMFSTETTKTIKHSQNCNYISAECLILIGCNWMPLFIRKTCTLSSAWWENTFFFYIYKYCFLTKLNHSTEVLEKKIYNIFVHWPFFVRVCVHVCVCVNKWLEFCIFVSYSKWHLIYPICRSF